MKDFKYYSTPKTPYPAFNAVKLEVEIRMKDEIGTETQLRERRRNITEETQQKINEQRNRHNNELNDLIAEFKRDIYDNFYVTDHPKADKVFQMAWDRGHADGFESVYNEFEELVELIR